MIFGVLTTNKYPKLTIISGLEKKILAPRLGKKYDIPELTLAVNIIKEARANKILQNLLIREVAAGNSSNVSVFFEQGLEVKIGQDDTKGKINILAELLRQPKNDLDKIKYIDLRFKDPVVKLKNVQ